MTFVYGMEPPKEMTEIFGKESTVDIHVRQIFVAFIHYISVGLVVHKGEHLFAIIAYHLAVAPCYCGNGMETI